MTGAESGATTGPGRRLAGILAADVVGYSRLMGTDEDGTLARVQSLLCEVAGPAVTARHGRIFRLMGDAFLAEFPSAVGAVLCAAEIQQAMATCEAPLPEAARLRLRIGVHMGDVLPQGDDLMGDGVNIAARLEGVAEPGGIAVSAAVAEAARGKLPFALEDGGETALKNIHHPVRIWRWPPGSATRYSAAAPETAAAPMADARPRVAVLPFDSMVSGPAHQFLADGLCEDLTTALSKLDTLSVVSRTAAFVYKGRNASAVVAGRELDAGYVIEGSVRTAGSRVRINAQLIERDTGAHVWAQKFDGTVDDIFDLQDRITQEIVAALEVRLSDGAMVLVWRAEAGDPEAYEHFLAGRAAYKEYSRAGNARARRSYEEALRRSPRFISAAAGLARTHIEDATFGWSPDKGASLAEARRLLDGAFALVPEHALARAELAHALMVEQRFEEGCREALRAVEADPNLADAAHVLATLLVALGRHEEAQAAVRRIGAVNPRFTVQRWHRNLFYPNRPDLAGFRALQAGAGLPEGQGAAPPVASSAFSPT